MNNRHPLDYEACGECGYDHSYEPEEAGRAHAKSRGAARRAEKEAFKNALLVEFGVKTNPKAERCFEIAWNAGHASGLEEVRGWFAEIVDLIK